MGALDWEDPLSDRIPMTDLGLIHMLIRWGEIVGDGCDDCGLPEEFMGSGTRSTPVLSVGTSSVRAVETLAMSASAFGAAPAAQRDVSASGWISTSSTNLG